MDSVKKIDGACFMKKPKKVLRLWLWLWQMQQQKHKALDYDESLKESLLPSDQKYKVPKGFLGVYVGPELRRFVIPMAFLSMPDFRVLMVSVAEECGYEHEGALEFPCQEGEFEQILLRCVKTHQMMLKIKNKR